MGQSSSAGLVNLHSAQNFLSKHKRFLQGFCLWSLVTLFYAFDNLLNVSPGGMKPELIEAFGLTAAQFGMLSTCYLWSYGLMQIPAGILMDTVGPRRLLTFAALICAIGAWLFASAHSITIAAIARVFIGFGASFAILGCANIASTWFDERQFAFFMGLMGSVGMFGAGFGLASISPIISYLGWRKIMLYASAIAVGFAGCMYLFIRDSSNAQQQDKDIDIDYKATLKHIGSLLKSVNSWLISGYAGLMFVPTLAFGALWGVPYLVEGHGFSQVVAGNLTACLFIGWIFGAPGYGWLYSKMTSSFPLMIFANVATLAVVLGLIYVPSMNYAGWAIGFFLLGLLSSGFVLAFSLVREQNPPETAGTSIGFVNMINTFSAAIFQWFIGGLLQWISTDNAVFSLSDYRKVLVCIPICLCLSLWMLLRLKIRAS